MNKINILLVSLFLILTNKFVLSQEHLFEKVSKQYSLTGGVAKTLTSNVNGLAVWGYDFEFDYAWKLSGYNKKKNSYISVPIGYQSYYSNEAINISILYYGWTVRHNLKKDKKWIPFISYGLLLNQVWREGTSGNEMGHQTRFTFGINRSMNNKTKLTLSLNYSLIRIPKLNQDKADKFTRLSIITGLRFG